MADKYIKCDVARNIIYMETNKLDMINAIYNSCSADVSPDELIEFANWVAKEVCCLEYEWDSKSWSFQEIACRKLVKMGIVKEEDGTYLYEEEET